MLDQVVGPQHVLEAEPFLLCHIQIRRNVALSTESADHLHNIAVARMLYMNALIKTQPSYFFGKNLYFLCSYVEVGLNFL